jgi:hypothetical protein
MGSMRPRGLLPRSAIESLPKCHRSSRKSLIQNVFTTLELMGCFEIERLNGIAARQHRWPSDGIRAFLSCL